MAELDRWLGTSPSNFNPIAWSLLVVVIYMYPNCRNFYCIGHYLNYNKNRYKIGYMYNLKLSTSHNAFKIVSLPTDLSFNP